MASRTDPAAPRIEIDPELVERYVMELAAFGAVGETGVSRPVYGPAWVAAADQYAAWCADAGLESEARCGRQCLGRARRQRGRRLDRLGLAPRFPDPGRPL